MSNSQLIAVSNLEKSPVNARKTFNQKSLEELKASILTHGIMQNLLVTSQDDKTGKYYVIAGARRLEAMQQLQQEKKLSADCAVPCQIKADGDDLELSIAENTVREAMHPADEFEAYAKLAENGADAEETALRFGVDKKRVLQRMKLGRVAPALMEEFRKGNIDLEALEAFTVTDDQKEQLKTYKGLDKWSKQAWNIRKLLTEKMVSDSSKEAQFVGMKEYEAAGGKIRPNLFQDEAYLEDPKLLQKLFTEKMNERVEKLKKEGWREVHVLDGYSYEFFDKYQKSTETIKAEDRGNYDCVIYVDRDGKLDVTKGMKMRKASAEKKAKKDEKGAYSNALRTRLVAYRQQIAQTVLVMHDDIAIDWMIYTAAMRFFGENGEQYSYDGLDIKFSDNTPTMLAKEKTITSDFLKAQKEQIDLSWYKKHKTAAARFDALRELPDTEKQYLLGWCIAHTLIGQLGDSPDMVEYVLSLTKADAATYWRPTKDNFLSSITTSQLTEIAQYLFGKTWKAKAANKSYLVTLLHDAFADPAKAAAGDAAMQERIQNWLPEGMTFTLPEAKPAKKRKAA